MTDATKPAGDLVQRLRQERRPTAWTRGLDTDYPTAWEPNPLCHEAADEIDRLTAALAGRERAIAEAVAGEREACAVQCEATPWTSDIDWWRKATKREVSVRSAIECAAAIRARSGAKG